MGAKRLKSVFQKFGRYVISEGCKTGRVERGFRDKFWGCVISEGCKTVPSTAKADDTFGRCVVSERYKTLLARMMYYQKLRGM